jgi:iron complex outermembrane receptor protein
MAISTACTSAAPSSPTISAAPRDAGRGRGGSQATNNLGGTIEFSSLDPLDHFAFDAAASYGSFNMWRAFGRLNLAAANGGARGYIAVDHHDTEKWKAMATSARRWSTPRRGAGGQGRSVGLRLYSDRAEVDYQDLSLEMLGRLGYNWDNISNNYALAVKVADVAANNGYSGAVATNPSAGTAWPAPFKNADDAYYSGGGLRKDTLAWLGVKSALGGKFTGEVKAYYHHNDGRGLWWTPYVNSPNGIPLRCAPPNTDRPRRPVRQCFGRNRQPKLTIGGWWEQMASTRPAAIMPWPAAPIRPGPARLAGNPFATQWEFNFKTETLQYYVQDTAKLAR